MPLPNAPQPWQANQPPATDSPVVVRTALPRRRSAFDAENLMGIVGVLVMLTAAGIGARLYLDEWWRDLFGKGGNKPVRVERKDTPSLPPPPVKNGRGATAKQPSQVEPDPAPQSRQAPQPRGDLAAAEDHLKTALANIRKGAFDEADLDTRKAITAAPDFDEAQAMRLAVGYVRQYSKLADDAMAALDGNCVVDLGPKHGQAAFNSRQDDGSITFQVKGRPRAFKPAELAGIPGVRFRVTESFLDNEIKPEIKSANDMILGAYHFVQKIDGDGKVDPTGNASRDAARERWRKAEIAGDDQTREQAGLLLKLLDMELPD
ncbi:MAG: hypothetical protein ACKOHK_10215 [Planctomycetia bacterium]